MHDLQNCLPRNCGSSTNTLHESWKGEAKEEGLNWFYFTTFYNVDMTLGSSKSKDKTWIWERMVLADSWLLRNTVTFWIQNLLYFYSFFECNLKGDATYLPIYVSIYIKSYLAKLWLHGGKVAIHFKLFKINLARCWYIVSRTSEIHTTKREMLAVSQF